MLNAAIELILEHGARVSMAAIGQRSGFSHGLVMARFGSKAGLLKAVTREVQRQFVAKVTSGAQGAKGLDGLLKLVDAFFRKSTSGSMIGSAFYVLLGEALGPGPDIRQVFVGADEAFRRYVGRMLDEAKVLGEIETTVSAHEMSALLVGMLRGVAMQARVNPRAFDTDALRRETRSLIEGLRCSQPPAAS
jgi:AcrR family transcriptional regulator